MKIDPEKVLSRFRGTIIFPSGNQPLGITPTEREAALVKALCDELNTQIDQALQSIDATSLERLGMLIAERALRRESACNEVPPGYASPIRCERPAGHDGEHATRNGMTEIVWRATNNGTPVLKIGHHDGCLGRSPCMCEPTRTTDRHYPREPALSAEGRATYARLREQYGRARLERVRLWRPSDVPGVSTPAIGILGAQVAYQPDTQGSPPWIPCRMGIRDLGGGDYEVTLIGEEECDAVAIRIEPSPGVFGDFTPVIKAL